MEFSERETGHEMLKWREFMGGEGVSVIFFKKNTWVTNVYSVG